MFYSSFLFFRTHWKIPIEASCCRCKSTSRGNISRTSDHQLTSANFVPEVHKFIVHKVLTLTAKKRDQRDYKNSDNNRLVEIKVKLEAN